MLPSSLSLLPFLSFLFIPLADNYPYAALHPGYRQNKLKWNHIKYFGRPNNKIKDIYNICSLNYQNK